MPPISRVDAENALAAGRKSLTWLAQEIGVNRQALTNWLEGTSNPRDETVWDRIRERLESLGAGVGPPLYPVGTPETPVPFWPWHAAGGWCNPEESIDWFDLPHFLLKPNRIVTQVQGTSMEPMIFEGDYLVFQLDSAPRYGRVVIARNHNGGATVKVLRRAPDGTPKLEPVNTSHDCPDLADGLINIGYLVAILRDYAKGRGSIIWDEGGLTP